MISSVKKFGRVRLSTNFPSKQIWRRMRTLKDDEFLLGFTFYGIQTSRKGFHELFSWNFWISGGVMYEQFMSDFAYHDSAPWQVQLFITGRNMSIIPIVDKIRSHNFLWLSTLFNYDWFWSTLIDFDRFQSTNTKSEIQKTMYGGKKEYSCRGQINKAALAMPRLHFTALVL